MNVQEALDLLNKLRNVAEQFTADVGKTENELIMDRPDQALIALDSAIDRWNVLINRAPSTLKKVKQQHFSIK